MRLVPFALALSTALALPAAAQNTIKVPADFGTIQEAVDAAADNDTILVSKGTYAEDVFVQSKTGLVIRAKGKVIIAPPAGVAMFLDTCTNVRVEKIRTSGGTTGIRLLDSSDCTVSKCRVEDSTDAGIRLDGGTGNVLEKCIVSGSQGDGISLGGGSATPVSETRVSKCTVIEPQDDGVLVNGTDNLVEKCQVRDGGDDGFVVDEGVTGTANIFRDCRTLRVVDENFTATGDENLFERCKVVQGQVGPSFYVLSGTGNVLRQCKAAKSNGIDVSEVATNTVIEDCKVKAALTNGLRVQGIGTQVTGNTITGCNGHGVVIAADVCLFEGNKSNGNEEDGFFLGVGSGGNTLSQNVGKGNKIWDLEDTSGEVNNVDDTNKFKKVAPP